MAEPIEMEFGMLIWVGPENMFHMGMYMHNFVAIAHSVGVSGRLKSIVKHRIWGLGKRVRGVKKTSGPTVTIYASYDVFLLKKLLFEVAMIEGRYYYCVTFRIQ